jgi:hypothetical protein
MDMWIYGVYLVWLIFSIVVPSLTDAGSRASLVSMSRLLGVPSSRESALVLARQWGSATLVRCQHKRR